ncbi:MAG: exodeoxyribonuclease VII small subunit [Verrucomicrobiota bacterium]
MSRKKDNPASVPAGPCFEDALVGLEAIVEAMEHEQLPLEELVSNYEQGSALLNHCEAILKSARGRIELITLRNPNEIALDSAAMSDQVSAHPSATGGGPDDDDDIRLF